MDAEQHRQIVLEIEHTKGAQSAHEQVCEQRYLRIGTALEQHGRDITEIKDSLKVAINRGAFVEDRLKGSTGNVIGPQRKIISDRKLAESIRVIVIERVP